LAPLDYSAYPELAVVLLAVEGNQQAFAELVQRKQSWLRGFMHYCCGNEALADDLAQQSFILAWSKISQLRQPESFHSWLKRLAVNTWLQTARAQKNWDTMDELPDDEHADAALSLDLNQVLASLPDAVRVCVVLAYHEGHTHDEIANMTELPLGTVKSHIKRGAAKLQLLLTDYQETSDD